MLFLICFSPESILFWFFSNQACRHILELCNFFFPLRGIFITRIQKRCFTKNLKNEIFQISESNMTPKEPIYQIQQICYIVSDLQFFFFKVSNILHVQLKPLFQAPFLFLPILELTTNLMVMETLLIHFVTSQMFSTVAFHEVVRRIHFFPSKNRLNIYCSSVYFRCRGQSAE